MLYKLVFLWYQMKATEQYFPVVSRWYSFPVVLFIMLYNLVQTFESVDEIRKCGESYQAVLNLSCGAVYYAVQFGSNF